MGKISVLLVDDHTVMRKALAALLGTCGEIEVAGEASDGAGGVAAALRLRPDVVVMDMLMPGIDGAEATRRILEEWPGAKILVLTTLGTSDAFARALECGARGAIMKNADLPGLRAAISDVAAGKRHLSPEVEQILADDPPAPRLSRRQTEILQFAARGFSNADIARALGISPPVVNEHLRAAFAKLGAANRTEAVAIALGKRILAP